MGIMIVGIVKKGPNSGLLAGYSRLKAWAYRGTIRVEIDLEKRLQYYYIVGIGFRVPVGLEDEMKKSMKL